MKLVFLGGDLPGLCGICGVSQFNGLNGCSRCKKKFPRVKSGTVITHYVIINIGRYIYR